MISGLTRTERLLRLALVGRVNDDDAARHADLYRGKPNARRGVHGLQHIVHQLDDGGVDLLDRIRNLAQNGVGNGDDRKNAHKAQIGRRALAVNRVRAICLNAGGPTGSGGRSRSMRLAQPFSRQRRRGTTPCRGALAPRQPGRRRHGPRGRLCRRAARRQRTPGNGRGRTGRRPEPSPQRCNNFPNRQRCPLRDQKRPPAAAGVTRTWATASAKLATVSSERRA